MIPSNMPLCGKGIYIKRWCLILISFIYIVQLLKEDCIMLWICWVLEKSSPTIEQIVHFMCNKHGDHVLSSSHKYRNEVKTNNGALKNTYRY